MNKNKIHEVMPTVLFVSGIAGIFVSEVMCARDTLKATKIIYDKGIELVPEEEVEHYSDEYILCTTKPQYLKECAKATWKCYIPTAVATTATLAALIASNRLTARQIALLSSAVASGGALVQKYRKEILDRTNPEILHEIDSAVANATMKEKRPSVVTTGRYEEELDDSGDKEYLFYDPFTNMKFRSTRLAVFGAKYYLNRNFAIGSGVPLSMFYAFLGLDLPEPFNQLGWEIGDEYDSAWVDIECSKSDELDPETGEEYYIIEYPFEPTYPESYYPFGNPIETEGSYTR